MAAWGGRERELAHGPFSGRFAAMEGMRLNGCETKGGCGEASTGTKMIKFIVEKKANAVYKGRKRIKHRGVEEIRAFIY